MGTICCVERSGHSMKYLPPPKDDFDAHADTSEPGRTNHTNNTPPPLTPGHQTELESAPPQRHSSEHGHVWARGRWKLASSAITLWNIIHHPHDSPVHQSIESELRQSTIVAPEDSFIASDQTQNVHPKAHPPRRAHRAHSPHAHPVRLKVQADEEEDDDGAHDVHREIVGEDHGNPCITPLSNADPLLSATAPSGDITTTAGPPVRGKGKGKGRGPPVRGKGKGIRLVPGDECKYHHSTKVRSLFWEKLAESNVKGSVWDWEPDAGRNSETGEGFVA